MGKNNLAFRLEQVKVPVFGPEAGIPFPRFGQSLGEGVTEDGFVSEVEEAAIGLVGKISKHEYMSRMAVAGTMPRLNRVFEEVRIIYREREVPAEVLASIEKKKKKAYAKNVTAEAESKKRKGAVGSRAPVKKKKKSGAPLIAPALSSAGSAGAASAGSEDIESSSAPSADARVASRGGSWLSRSSGVPDERGGDRCRASGDRRCPGELLAWCYERRRTAGG